MDLVGPTRTKSRGGKSFFGSNRWLLQYTWVAFLREKLDAFQELTNLAKWTQNEIGLTIRHIMSDHSGEIENSLFEEFCVENATWNFIP